MQLDCKCKIVRNNSIDSNLKMSITRIGQVKGYQNAISGIDKLVAQETTDPDRLGTIVGVIEITRRADYHSERLVGCGVGGYRNKPI